MTRPLPRRLTLSLSLLALAACGETPTQPETAGDLSAAASSFAWPSNSWTAKAPIPGPFFGLAAGAAINSTGQRIVYLFGGNLMDMMNLHIYAYDMVTNTWTLKQPLFEGFANNGVGNIGGKLYISGGISYTGEPGGTMFPRLLAYDPVTDRLTVKAAMPRPTAYGVTGVINGKLYVLSGDCTDELPPVFDCERASVRRLLYRYDPVTDTWATLRPAPHFHLSGGGGVIRGKFYVAGGYGDAASGYQASTKLDVYDPSSNTWTTLAPMAAPRSTGAIMNSKLWMIGASGSNRSTYVYDPVTNRWSTKAPYPTGQSAPSAAVPFPFEGQSHILTLGSGQGPNGETPAPMQVYTP